VSEVEGFREAAPLRIREGLEASLLLKLACPRRMAWVRIDRTCPRVDLTPTERRTIWGLLDLVDFGTGTPQQGKAMDESPF
jgi:hypothetical protein